MDKKPDKKTYNMIELASLFSAGKRLDYYAIARAFGTSTRTAERYVRDLELAGFALDSDLDSSGRRVFFAPTSKRIFKPALNAGQAISLAVALEILKSYEGSVLYDTLESLYDELNSWLSTLDPSMEEAEHWLGRKFFALRFLPYRYAEDGEAFNEVVSALLRNCKLSFKYKAISGSGKLKSYVVRPLTLAYHRNAFYLVGLKEGAEADATPRTFMLARMRDIERLTREHFKYPRDWDPQAHFMKMTGMLPGEVGRFVARFDGKFFDYLKNEREWDGYSSVRREPDGRVLFQADLALNDEFLNWIFGFGALAEVLEPPAFRAAIARKAAEVAALYEDDRPART